MTNTPAIPGTGPQRDQHDDTRETPVRHPDDLRAQAPGPDWTADHNEQPRVAADIEADRSPGMPAVRRPARSWPVLVLAAPAAVAVWSGWVGIGQMTGFGQIRPLPGIWDALHIDTAVTLPVGVEAYAAFALRAWLTSIPGAIIQLRSGLLPDGVYRRDLGRCQLRSGAPRGDFIQPGHAEPLAPYTEPQVTNMSSSTLSDSAQENSLVQVQEDVSGILIGPMCPPGVVFSVA